MEFSTNDGYQSDTALADEIISHFLEYMPNYTTEPKVESKPETVYFNENDMNGTLSDNLCNFSKNWTKDDINDYLMTKTERSTSDVIYQDISQSQSNSNDDDKATILILDDNNSNSSLENKPKYSDLINTNSTCNSLDENVMEIEELPEEEEHVIGCSYCDSKFKADKFMEHVCEYDNNKNLIQDHEQQTRINEILKDSFSEKLKENDIIVKKFVKECLKIDRGATAKKLDGPHECTLCDRKFVHASGLSRHMEKHALDMIPNNSNNLQTSSLPYVVAKCLSCGRVFFSIENFLEHYNKVQNQSLSDDCHWHENCNFDYNENENDEFDMDGESNLDIQKLENGSYNFAHEKLKKFEENSQTPKIFKIKIINSVLQCEFCSYLFINTADLLIHESKHDPLRAFECFECEIFVMTIKDIFLHWKTECPFSKEITRHPKNLQRYFVCNLCEHKFNSHEQLYEHRYSFLHFFPRYSNIFDAVALSCEYCGISHTKTKSAIEHYEENHKKKVKKAVPNKDRQYLCDVCGKSYTQSSHLWQHLRFHRGVKPFACSEPGCSRKFTIRPDLNDHIRKCHTGERPYHCLVCGKRFLTGSVFYQHRLIHRGERRYGCDDCGKRFYRADALKNHQRIHSGEKPYQCLYCPKCFRQRGDRDKHIRARHANLEANARAISAMANQKASEHGNGKDVVYIGNMAFPSSMFKPVIKDIDENL